MDELHIPDDWQAAIDTIAAQDFVRVVVIGATDTGKSSFVTALLRSAPERELIDVDPGQKLVGPPGTVSLGRLGPAGFDLGGFVFIGSTSSANIFLISRACEALAKASRRFVANTSGFVAKLGVRLQAATISALDADCIVALGGETALAPILDKHRHRAILPVRPAPAALRKTAAVRARLRQAALETALAAAETQALVGIVYEPAPPVAFAGSARPVCSLADAEGADMAVGVLEAVDSGPARAFAPPTVRPTAIVRLGSMWAEPRDGGWRLIETLHPSWVHDEPEG